MTKVCASCGQVLKSKARSLCRACYVAGVRSSGEVARCTVQDCAGYNHAKGLCQTHYSISRRMKREATAPACAVEDCDGRAFVRGLCTKHYQRERKAQRSGSCAVNSCGEVVHTKALCTGHYKQVMTYGLTVAQIEAQSGTCMSCGSAEKLCTDHDHTTGRTRGRLCSSCNTALGLLNEDVARMRGLIAYTETYCHLTN